MYITKKMLNEALWEINCWEAAYWDSIKAAEEAETEEVKAEHLAEADRMLSSLHGASGILNIMLTADGKECAYSEDEGRYIIRDKVTS